MPDPELPHEMDPNAPEPSLAPIAPEEPGFDPNGSPMAPGEKPPPD